MKYRYLKRFDFILYDNEGKALQGKFNGHGEVEFEHVFPYRMCLEELSDQGASFRYHNVTPYNIDTATHFLLEPNKPYEFIEDKTKLRCVFTAVYDEAELEEGELTLKIHEAAEDTDGGHYRPGEKDWEILAKKGEGTETQFLYKKNAPIKVVAVEGIDVTVQIEDQTFRINQYAMFSETMESGYNTRYDYFHWWHSLKIELKLPDDGFRKALNSEPRFTWYN